MNSWSKLIVFPLLGTLWSAPAAARDEAVACVQTYLNWQGHGSGTPDGQLGRRTAAAADAFLAKSGASLPALSAETVPIWCEFAQTDARYVAYQSFSYEGYGSDEWRFLPETCVNDQLIKYAIWLAAS